MNKSDLRHLQNTKQHASKLLDLKQHKLMLETKALAIPHVNTDVPLTKNHSIKKYNYALFEELSKCEKEIKECEDYINKSEKIIKKYDTYLQPLIYAVYVNNESYTSLSKTYTTGFNRNALRDLIQNEISKE